MVRLDSHKRFAEQLSPDSTPAMGRKSASPVAPEQGCAVYMDTDFGLTVPDAVGSRPELPTQKDPGATAQQFQVAAHNPEPCDHDRNPDECPDCALEAEACAESDRGEYSRHYQQGR